MRKLNITLVTRVLVLALLISLIALSAAIPVQAHVSGAKPAEETELMPIWIFVEEGEDLRRFAIEEAERGGGVDVRGYEPGMKLIEKDFGLGGKGKCPDGTLCICEACAYRVMELAISQLSPDDIPNQADFKITWTHPCPGHEKTFRYITGDVAEYEKDIPPGTSKKHLTLENYKYAFEYGEEEPFETEVLEGVFPADFFDKREEWVEAGKPGMGDGSIGDEFGPIFEEVRDKFLNDDLDELFDFEEEEEEEETPWWPIIFALGLTAAIIGTTIYSIAGIRR